MRVGVPKEIKRHEYRLGLTPGAVRELVAHGHEVIVESGAGAGICAEDAIFRSAGAHVAASAEEVFASADMIVKVKEPQASERTLLRPGQILFTYLHLAPDPVQTHALLASGTICIAYETVTAPDGSLPLLTPMSEVAGRMSVQAGAHYLERPNGGRGVLLSGVPGVEPARVVILGAGVVGSNAARMAAGSGADVTVLDCSPAALRRLDGQLGSRIKTVYADQENLHAAILHADLVIGAVLIAGAATPRLISRAMLAQMQAGAVIVDVAIDQGGCCETSRPTTHDEPTYVVDGVIHYCVSNMPGAVARTSTYALNAATQPFVMALADKGWRAALRDDAGLRSGLNLCMGHVTCAGVAAASGAELVPAESLLGV